MKSIALWLIPGLVVSVLLLAWHVDKLEREVKVLQQQKRGCFEN